MIALLIICAITSALDLMQGYVIFRGSKRILEFDDLYELLVHDLEMNVQYLDKLVSTPLFSNLPEVLEAQRNMRIIRDRLNEYVLRMEELTHRRLRKPAKPKLPRPRIA